MEILAWPDSHTPAEALHFQGSYANMKITYPEWLKWNYFRSVWTAENIKKFHFVGQSKWN